MKKAELLLAYGVMKEWIVDAFRPAFFATQASNTGRHALACAQKACHSEMETFGVTFRSLCFHVDVTSSIKALFAAGSVCCATLLGSGGSEGCSHPRPPQSEVEDDRRGGPPWRSRSLMARRT